MRRRGRGRRPAHRGDRPGQRRGPGFGDRVSVRTADAAERSTRRRSTSCSPTPPAVPPGAGPSTRWPTRLPGPTCWRWWRRRGRPASRSPPGSPTSSSPPGAEAEWVSYKGDVKEAVIWCGALAGETGSQGHDPAVGRHDDARPRPGPGRTRSRRPLHLRAGRRGDPGPSGRGDRRDGRGPPARPAHRLHHRRRRRTDTVGVPVRGPRDAAVLAQAAARRAPRARSRQRRPSRNAARRSMSTNCGKTYDFPETNPRWSFSPGSSTGRSPSYAILADQPKRQTRTIH